jgi:hypothetical protein
MAIAMFSLPNLFESVQALLGWLAPPRPAVAAPRPPVRAVAPRVVMVPAKPLRIVRVLEPSTPRAAAGRMVISGRFADVCAELDRLAAQESR